MLDVKPFKQSRGYCGPACMKIVLEFYGTDKTEEELAELTNSTRDGGCYESEIVRAAKNLGFNGYVKQNSSINELQKLINKSIPAIVDWDSPQEGGHYSVVADIDDNYIYLADPHFGKIKKYNIKWFEERWVDSFEGRKISKEIIVIHK